MDRVAIAPEDVRPALESDYSDTYKQLAGFRPRHDLSALTDEDLYQEIQALSQECESLVRNSLAPVAATVKIESVLATEKRRVLPCGPTPGDPSFWYCECEPEFPESGKVPCRYKR